MKTQHPDPTEFLTLSDIDPDDLPNGTATPLTVYDQFGHPVGTGLLDEVGFVRVEGGRYVPLDYSAEERSVVKTD